MSSMRWLHPGQGTRRRRLEAVLTDMVKQTPGGRNQEIHAVGWVGAKCPDECGRETYWQRRRGYFPRSEFQLARRCKHQSLRTWACAPVAQPAYGHGQGEGGGLAGARLGGQRRGRPGVREWPVSEQASAFHSPLPVTAATTDSARPSAENAWPRIFLKCCYVRAWSLSVRAVPTWETVRCAGV